MSHPKRNNKSRIIEVVVVGGIVLGLSMFLGSFGDDWATPPSQLLATIVEFVFRLLPIGVIIAMMLGGPHSVSEFQLTVSVFINLVFYYWIARWVIIKIVKWRQRP